MKSRYHFMFLPLVLSCATTLGARTANACGDERGERCASTDDTFEAWMENRFDASRRHGGTGARVSLTRVHGSDDDRTGSGLGLSFYGHEELYGLRGLFSLRSASFAFLGGGVHGLEGGLSGDTAAGVLLPVAKNQGPFFRMGGRGHLLGNGAYYVSYLEIPQLQLGYEAMGKGFLVEGAARGGPVLIGRFNTGVDAQRKLGRSFEVGGHAAVHAGPAHLEVEHTHILPEGNLGAVDLFASRLCGTAWVLHLCADARYGRGESTVPEGRPALDGPVEAYYGGLLLGVRQGVFEEYDKRHRRKRHDKPPRGPMIRATD